MKLADFGFARVLGSISEMVTTFVGECLMTRARVVVCVGVVG